jgi:hypothetical protein
MGFGDVLAQTLIEKRNLSDISWERTVPYASAGVFVVSNLLLSKIEPKCNLTTN